MGAIAGQRQVWRSSDQSEDNYGFKDAQHLNIGVSVRSGIS
jgi:hypothetical protein